MKISVRSQIGESTNDASVTKRGCVSVFVGPAMEAGGGLSLSLSRPVPTPLLHQLPLLLHNLDDGLSHGNKVINNSVKLASPSS